jgi:hypothetical protein
VPVASLKDRGCREIATIYEALANGAIDDQGRHDAMAALLRPAYLAATTPWEQSGKSGDEAGWVGARRFVVDALDRDGTFLDCGCANGYLMECVPEFVELARRRLPQWADRIWVGNAASWLPPLRFDAVRIGLEYVPEHRRAELVAHLLRKVVAAGGRLIVGPFTEEVEQRTTEDDLADWGHVIAGRSELPHRDPRVVRRLVWVDVP